MFMLMPIQIRIRIGIQTMPILMRILPQVLHMLENLNFFYLKFTALPVNNDLYFSSVFSVIWVIIYLNFGQDIEIFWKKV